MQKPFFYTTSSLFIAVGIFFALSGFSFTSAKPQTAGNLLQNGDFEASQAGLGMISLSGWRVLSGNVDVIPNNANVLWAWHQSADGSKSLELTGNPGAAIIEQSFPTEAGRKYMFSGWISHHFAISEAGVDVFVNGLSLEPLHHSTANSQANMKWERFSREFVAQSTTTTLRLSDRNLAGWEWGGAVVDGLAVSLVPLPQQPAELLQNGNFEAGAVGLGVTWVPGWQVTRGNVDVIPNDVNILWAWHQSADGIKSLELTGNPGVATIKQTFPTQVGRRYVFSGWVSHHFAISEAGVNVFVNGTALEPLFHNKANSQTDMMWERFTREFVANSSTTTLELSDRGIIYWPWGGAVVDGLSVTEAPGASPTPTPTITPSGIMAGQILTKMKMDVPAEVISQLSPAVIQRLQSEGLSISGNTVESALSRAQDHWIKIGNSFYATNSEGVFEIPAFPVNESIGFVYKNRNDTQPLGQFPLTALVPKGQVLTPIVIELSLIDTFGMDAPLQDSNLDSRSYNQEEAHSHLNLDEQIQSSNANQVSCNLWEPYVPDPIGVFGKDYFSSYNRSGCCLDYNGVVSNNIKYNGKVGLRPGDVPHAECERLRRINFFMSDCFDWSYSASRKNECKNERAFVKGGPSCWNNHKYRNCQQMNPIGFSLEMYFPSQIGDQEIFNITSPGDAYFIGVITNTTPANETTVRVIQDSGRGKFVLTHNFTYQEIPAVGEFSIPNYIENYTLPGTNLKFNAHVDSIQLIYIGPELKRGEPPYKASFSIEAYGIKRIINVTGIPPS